MFWGGIVKGRRTQLQPLMGDSRAKRNGVTASRILECLQKNLPAIVLPGDIFAQDNAPVHKAKIVKEWLAQWAQENEVIVVQWPPYSPDLNPIENAWKMLKESIAKQHPELSDMKSNKHSKTALIQAALEAWAVYRQEALDYLIFSMPRRLQAVIDANGWHTKY